MERKVGIVAMSQTKYEPAKRGLNFPELAYSVIKPMLQELEISINDTDQAITCCSDFWDGKTISNVTIQDVVGAYLRPEAKVASDGTQALIYAWLRVLSGAYDSALVVAHCKMSQSVPNQITWGSGDPFFMRPVGVDELNAAALQARAYMHAYGVTEEQCAKVSVKNKGNALLNPLAQDGKKITVDDVMRSPYLADPIKDLDRAPYSDGACALILASEEKARQWGKKPVWVAGAGTCMDLFFFGDRKLAELTSLYEASRKAYKMAGIQNPRKDINVVEIADGYSYQELMICEGLGLCGPGEGAKLLEKGATEIGGDIPVNPSGGMLGGCPEVVIGLNSVIEAAKQLNGTAGKHQVSKADVAAVHGRNGFNAQQNTVIILKNNLD
jgi:acetyl-CoA C-acetyltransferase